MTFADPYSKVLMFYIYCFYFALAGQFENEMAKNPFTQHRLYYNARYAEIWDGSKLLYKSELSTHERDCKIPKVKETIGMISFIRSTIYPKQMREKYTSVRCGHRPNNYKDTKL
jgi:hypothetical protein